MHLNTLHSGNLQLEISPEEEGRHFEGPGQSSVMQLVYSGNTKYMAAQYRENDLTISLLQ